MQDQDNLEFAECMKGLKEVYTPDKQLSAEKIEIYWRYFKEWSIERFKRACAKVMDVKTITTFPLPAEIVQADTGNGNTALNAWIIARRAVSAHGAYITLSFEDKVIHSVIEAMGGWIKFCQIPDQEIKWAQKDFERLYPLLPGSNHSEKLQGLHEKQTEIIIISNKPVKQIDGGVSLPE